MLRSFAQAYLVAYIFWLGLPLGSIFFLAVHRLTGGRWGQDIGSALRSSASTVPLMTALFIPVLLLMPQLYPWCRGGNFLTLLVPSLAGGGLPALPGADLPVLHPLYLSPAGFAVRAALYFCLWLFFSQRLRRTSAAANRPLAAAAILVLFITASLAAIDWLLTLSPNWYSSVYGLIFLTSSGLTALALAVAASGRRQDPLPTEANLGQQVAFTATAKAQGDLASLLLVALMCSGYAQFSQLIIMWSGGKPDEMAWYDARYQGGWQTAAWGLILGAYALPFGLLLFRRLKRRSAATLGIALVIGLGQILSDYWLIVPSFGRGAEVFRLMDLLPFTGIGVLWLARFRRQQLFTRGQHA